MNSMQSENDEQEEEDSNQENPLKNEEEKRLSDLAERIMAVLERDEEKLKEESEGEFKKLQDVVDEIVRFILFAFFNHYTFDVNLNSL